MLLKKSAVNGKKIQWRFVYMQEIKKVRGLSKDGCLKNFYTLHNKIEYIK